jgi:hypothetical protein
MRGIPLAVQVADAVLMVRPAAFGWNAQTCGSNFYQPRTPPIAGVHEQALAEFDAFARALRDAGVDVQVFDDAGTPLCPDAVFPNNWVSLHADGTVVLYPMLAVNRRLERRLELIAALAAEHGLAVRRLLDLTHYESRGLFLEGTGSVVFDHAQRIAYACLSPRTHREPLAELCDELGYTPCTFAASDVDGVAIYHTNVMLAVGPHTCVVAADAIDAVDRERVLSSLAVAGRTLETIDARQMAAFAGNVLELRAADGRSVLALSSTAREAFGPTAFARLAAAVDRVVVAAIPTIETLGGGSVRCMLAEVRLPR